jgi:1-acyl-sn-glycerol-3-phosphate acyltransferase
VSWADILILGAATRTSFVAKREVRGWPVLGWLAAQHGTLFVDREARTAVTQQRDEIVAAVRAGRQLTLFAEGTSSDGSNVLPFKSALFSAAYAGALIVRPVTIVWARVGGAEICDHNRTGHRLDRGDDPGAAPVAGAASRRRSEQACAA